MFMSGLTTGMDASAKAASTLREPLESGVGLVP
jgi:hypothetical protein